MRHFLTRTAKADRAFSSFLLFFLYLQLAVARRTSKPQDGGDKREVAWVPDHTWRRNAQKIHLTGTTCPGLGIDENYPSVGLNG